MTEFVLGLGVGALLAGIVLFLQGWVPAATSSMNLTRLQAQQQENAELTKALREQRESFTAEIARLADLNGTLEAERNNALETAAFYREAWLVERHFYELRRERYAAVTTDEVEIEHRAHEVLVRAETLDQGQQLSRVKTMPLTMRLEP